MSSSKTMMDSAYSNHAVYTVGVAGFHGFCGLWRVGAPPYGIFDVISSPLGSRLASCHSFCVFRGMDSSCVAFFSKCVMGWMKRVYQGLTHMTFLKNRQKQYCASDCFLFFLLSQIMHIYFRTQKTPTHSTKQIYHC